MPWVALDSGVRLSYWERGGRRDPTVVLLPGATDSWRSYDPVLAALPAGLRVVAVSLRGHGDSSKPPSGYGIGHLASDVVPLLDALHVDRAVLVGHSSSCLVARRVALDAPDRVGGLFLEAAPTTLRGHPDLMRFVNTAVAGLEDPVDGDFARSFVADTSTDRLDARLVRLMVDEVLKVPVAAWKEMFASLLTYDDTPDLPQVEAPARLVWGDADSLVPRSMQDDLVRLLPRAELVVYEGAGHTPRWEQPGRFATDLAAFVSSVSR